MRVLLADDEPNARSALRSILEQLTEVESVEEVDDARSLESFLENTPPDLLLVNRELPGLRPWTTLYELCNRYPFKVIVLNGHGTAPKNTIHAGADAHVSRYEWPDRLFATLRTMSPD